MITRNPDTHQLPTEENNESRAMERVSVSMAPNVTVVPSEALRRVHVAIERTDADFAQLHAAMEWQLAESANANHWDDAAEHLTDPLLDVDSVFGITSAVPGEGKTTIAMHLAFSIARNSGRKVCLIDLGLGDNEICRRIGVRTEKGLVNVLEGEDYIIRTLQLSDCGDLSVMPAGKLPRNPNKAARSAAVTEIIAAAREIYDTVIVDLPAVSTGNALPIAEHLDKVMLVVCSGVTPKDIVQQAVDRLGRKRVLGVVLNRMKSSMPNKIQQFFRKVA
ncbi:CpsD/CapB family tyrosine-protein kinase [Armatimonas sp.]|uniref:CpsD/CapB family tyrosine-protein kinase n=1 Tax=Armatimonas sp. TaxID=1872638 RepID=UPI00286D301F|nr:CpsD/CapB family tyrosine-protein kinase [Armatimonas sp.]